MRLKFDAPDEKTGGTNISKFYKQCQLPIVFESSTSNNKTDWERDIMSSGEDDKNSIEFSILESNYST